MTDNDGPDRCGLLRATERDRFNRWTKAGAWSCATAFGFDVENVDAARGRSGVFDVSS